MFRCDTNLQMQAPREELEGRLARMLSGSRVLSVGVALLVGVAWTGPVVYAQQSVRVSQASSKDESRGKRKRTKKRTKKSDRVRTGDKKRRKAKRKSKTEPKKSAKVVGQKKARAERRARRKAKKTKAEADKKAKAEAKKKARAERKKRRREAKAKARAEKRAKAEAKKKARAERRKRRLEAKANKKGKGSRARAEAAEAKKRAEAERAAKAEAERARVEAEKAKRAKAAEKAKRAKAKKAGGTQSGKKRNKTKKASAKKSGKKRNARAKKAEGAPLSVLVLALTGESLEPDAPHPLTDALVRAVGALEGRPVQTRTGTAGTIDITGCSAETEECFDAVADVLGVEWMVFGAVEAPQDDDAVPVTLTLVDAKRRTYTSRRVVLLSAAGRQREAELETRAQAFLDGEPDPGPSKQVVMKDRTKPASRPERNWNLGRVGGPAWTLSGGGAVAIATGVLLLSAAGDMQSEVDAAPIDDVADFEHLQRLERNGQRMTLWGNGMLVVGGLATVIGLGLIVKQGFVDSRERPSVTLDVVPGVGRERGVSVVFGGRF